MKIILTRNAKAWQAIEPGGMQDLDLQQVLMATAAIFHLRAKSSYDLNTAKVF